MLVVALTIPTGVTDVIGVGNVFVKGAALLAARTATLGGRRLTKVVLDIVAIRADSN
jgi:hypothetical protein